MGVSKGKAERSGTGWLQAAGTLRERGRLAWALGAAMEKVLQASPAAAVDDVSVMEAMVAEAVRQLAGGQQVRVAGKGLGEGARRAAETRSTGPSDAAATWRQLQAADLAERAIPVVWLASGAAGG